MSSIHFDNQLPLTDPGAVRCVAWSKGEDAPLLAVAEGTQVRIFRDEGEELIESVQSRAVSCTSLAWHPRAKVVAAGWEDGVVTFAGPAASGSGEDREVHRDAQIVCIAFNPLGLQCVTTDTQGVVGVWKTDPKGVLSGVCHYRRSGPHDKVIFRTTMPTGEVNLETPPFFFGGESGIIYLADDYGVCSERYKVGCPLLLLEYFHQKDMVIIITKNVELRQFSLDAAGKVVNENKLKLSCGPNPERLQGTWAGNGLLATCSHESIVRLWNLADDESYILSLQGVDERNSLAGDKVTSIDFNPRKRVLAAGTRNGRVVRWRCSILNGTPKSEENWQVLPVITGSDRSIERLSWGPGENVFHIQTPTSNVILQEAQLNTAVQAPYMLVQTAPTQVLLYQVDKDGRCFIQAPFRVKGLSMGGGMPLLWNSKQVAVYDVDPQTLNASLRSQFKHEAPIVQAIMYAPSQQDQYIIIASGSVIEFCNLQGMLQRTLPISAEVDGTVTSLDVKGNFMVASTSNSIIRVWQIIARKDPKPVGTARKFEGDGYRSLGEIQSVRINSDGTKVSLLVEQKLAPGGLHGNAPLRVPDSRVWVYDLDTDKFLTYHVGKRMVPVSHAWDSDPRLMVSEVVPQALAYDGEDFMETLRQEEPVHSVVTLFVAKDLDKILLQDSVPCADAARGGAPRMPVAVIVPHIYFAKQLDEAGGDATDSVTTVISRVVLRDFAGLDSVDRETTAALLNFSYHIACGNTDEAYKSVKGVHSSGVWENMSKMCVKTGRLDVAQKCLGQIGHARAAGALRACEEPEEEAKLAIIAIHLDMIEDAESLLKKCQRWDLLNQLYQASGEWEKALEVAKTKDRVHLKPTHFAYAQYLEAVEDVQRALEHFELSGTYRTENPRLLCSMGLTDNLKAYVEQSDDSHLQRWYAQYLESKANLDGAASYYKKAGDWLSLCRVACFNKDLERAQKICEESQDQAACYHLARHLEAEGRTKESIKLFEMAGRLSHALRLAQENNMDGDLMSLALASDPANMAQAAKYYEQRGQPSKAVVLYQKAGYQKRALELCFSARLFDALRKIADDLNAESDPEILAKCAEFFMQHNQHDKAVHLLSMSQQYEKAVDLCEEHDVHITEDMAERMTPDKSKMAQEQRAEILQNIAKLCKKQGSFQLACKKYTQAGDKLKAMKSLLKSGDTDKIIFFAGTARQPDIYVLAGNYLQSLDWHNDPEIMKNIIQYYTKAKAYDKLASFYDACAQVEIDEYRDYDKAAGALREALKYMFKAAGPGAEADDRVLTLQNRISIVEKFAEVRKLAKSDPESMATVCRKLLELQELETAVRVGDVFAQLVEYYAEVRNFTMAHQTIEQMRQRGIILSPYVDRALLETVYGAVNLPPPAAEPSQGGGGAGGAAAPAQAPQDDLDVGEEIEEEES
mmetsp:Transcript_42942/g.100869  ORF Transcript_42942/g.100869 Transcript_42942/m.100869 type:complete len:1420 (-) Transcript_42942:132-4391(-)